MHSARVRLPEDSAFASGARPAPRRAIRPHRCGSHFSSTWLRGRRRAAPLSSTLPKAFCGPCGVSSKVRGLLLVDWSGRPRVVQGGGRLGGAGRRRGSRSDRPNRPHRFPPPPPRTATHRRQRGHSDEFGLKVSPLSQATLRRHSAATSPPSVATTHRLARWRRSRRSAQACLGPQREHLVAAAAAHMGEGARASEAGVWELRSATCKRFVLVWTSAMLPLPRRRRSSSCCGWKWLRPSASFRWLRRTWRPCTQQRC